MKVIEEDIQDIEFVIGELCSNVTRHSHSVNGRFVVSVDFFPDKFVVEVKDNGGGFSFKDVKPVGSVREDFGGAERYGGFGLFLVEMMADHLEFARTEPTGTTVRAEKMLHYVTLKDRCDADAMNSMHGGGVLKISS
jgi:anti-sigma regulatory factor (Ser/Thr protein kinase)